MNEETVGQLVVSPEQMERMAAHCQQAYPFEGCGMLLGRAANGRKVVVDVLLTGNAREEEARHNRYLIPRASRILSYAALTVRIFSRAYLANSSLRPLAARVSG